MKKSFKALLKFIDKHGVMSKIILYFISPLLAIFIYSEFNSIVYSINSSKPKSEQLFFSTTEASAAYASGIFSALSLLLLTFTFFYQSRDSKKKEYQFLSQQFSQNFNNRLALYKTLLSNIDGDVFIIYNIGPSKQHFEGLPYLHKKLNYINLPLSEKNIVKIRDSSNNVINFCNICSYDFECFNEPFYELFSLLQYTCNSKSISDEEKEIYFERIRNLTKIELIWLLLFCVSNKQIKNNLSILNQSKVLTELPSPYNSNSTVNSSLTILRFLKSNNLITKELFEK